jgi:hypothetical protein
MLTEAYFKTLGEIAILEIFDSLKWSMELRRMNSRTEEFNLSNIAMLMDFAMQFGIDIEKFNTEMK